jgi:hypothetical protein
MKCDKLHTYTLQSEELLACIDSSQVQLSLVLKTAKPIMILLLKLLLSKPLSHKLKFSTTVITYHRPYR